MSPNLPEPAIQTRAQWGADESLMRWTPQPRALRAAVVHHTAGTNNYTQAQAPGVVRGIYVYHATQRDGNGWGDIGYNFLVDRFGRIYEGRTGSRTAQPGQMTQGAHALGFNNGTLGISVMGNYSSMNASSTVLNSMANVIAWQFSRAGIAVDTRSGMISPGSPTRPAGQNLPRIFGHRDVSNTTCPGRIQNQLGTIRNLVRTKMPTLYRLNNTFTGSANYSYYFGARNAQVFVGDWNGDGIDTPAVRVGNRISINNSNSYSSPDQVFTYGRASDELFVGDWNGDGRDTFALRRAGVIYIRNTFGGSASQVLSNYGRANE
ncbi:N-acetylmuramoyl-L-alanine amidase [Sanguibacter sp. Z1732]|uniref:N-acetylmuramoyl-L-alanine amidase n=1 Tax=Sanguibacter sp. Z1732 TaxID=3435412 RepID=UPI003D9C8FDF